MMTRRFETHIQTGCMNLKASQYRVNTCIMKVTPTKVNNWEKGERLFSFCHRGHNMCIKFNPCSPIVSKFWGVFQPVFLKTSVCTLDSIKTKSSKKERKLKKPPEKIYLK